MSWQLAGKLSALFSRNVSRDLFDVHYLLTQEKIEFKNLREAFVVYLAMTKIDLLTLTPNVITYDLVDIKNLLASFMHQQILPKKNCN